MALRKFQIPDKPFQIQKAMIRVCFALVPLVVASIYLFGWRSLVLVAVALRDLQPGPPPSFVVWPWPLDC